ncbi:DUF1828 domain-containing protein [Caballeronia sp. Sq4a]|uniref:DUF1828 domain-containing protein n=1 Tax=Caballeronia sp. Sq4a TaxID=2878152 RepID=UPI0020C0CB3B|nr:DUF1828 domain-containing protein [Caballeronia sp. Sq4a]
MNCDQLLQVTSWECTPSGTRSVRAVSPFTLGNDGRHAAFYLASPTDDTFYLTDGGETAMHAAQSGIELTKARIEQLNRTPGVRFAHFGGNFAITAEGAADEAEMALWDAVKLAMSLSFSSEKWMPKIDHVRFRALVQSALVRVLGSERVSTSYRTKGISGHIVEFPLAVKSANDRLYLIEPIALAGGEKIDWGRVHQVYGKLADVKQADEVADRLVVFEEGASQAEFGRAATLLAQTAEVTAYRELTRWTERALAA